MPLSTLPILASIPQRSSAAVTTPPEPHSIARFSRYDLVTGSPVLLAESRDQLCL